jgi:hypothetical protein
MFTLPKQKMPGGKYRARKLFTTVKNFSVSQHPPQQISGYASEYFTPKFIDHTCQFSTVDCHL